MPRAAEQYRVHNHYFHPNTGKDSHAETRNPFKCEDEHEFYTVDCVPAAFEGGLSEGDVHVSERPDIREFAIVLRDNRGKKVRDNNGGITWIVVTRD